MIFINVFTVYDFLIFYIFFEAIVIPMFLLLVFEVVDLEKFMLPINFFYIHYLDLFLFYLLFYLYILVKVLHLMIFFYIIFIML